MRKPKNRPLVVANLRGGFCRRVDEGWATTCFWRELRVRTLRRNLPNKNDAASGPCPIRYLSERQNCQGRLRWHARRDGVGNRWKIFSAGGTTRVLVWGPRPSTIFACGWPSWRDGIAAGHQLRTAPHRRSNNFRLISACAAGRQFWIMCDVIHCANLSGKERLLRAFLCAYCLRVGQYKTSPPSY